MNSHNNIQYDFKSIGIVRKQQHRNPPDNTKYTSDVTETAYPFSFAFPAFPQAKIVKLRLCNYHQYLNGLHQQIVHQYDPVSPLVVLE